MWLCDFSSSYRGDSPDFSRKYLEFYIRLKIGFDTYRTYLFCCFASVSFWILTFTTIYSTLCVVNSVIFSGWGRPHRTPCGLAGGKVTWCPTWLRPPNLSAGRLRPRSRNQRLLSRFQSRRRTPARTVCGPGGGRATFSYTSRQEVWPDVDLLNWEILLEILFYFGQSY